MALAHVGQALEVVARVLDHGDQKYGIAAWLKNGQTADFNLWDHIKGIERHLARRNRGEIVDESGELALAHVVARGLLALTFEIQIKETQRGECGEPLVHALNDQPTAICTLTAGHQPPNVHYDGVQDVEWTDMGAGLAPVVEYPPESEEPAITEGDPR